jgi:hypothetical protein
VGARCSEDFARSFYPISMHSPTSCYFFAGVEIFCSSRPENNAEEQHEPLAMAANVLLLSGYLDSWV